MNHERVFQCRSYVFSFLICLYGYDKNNFTIPQGSFKINRIFSIFKIQDVDNAISCGQVGWDYFSVCNVLFETGQEDRVKEVA